MDGLTNGNLVLLMDVFLDQIVLMDQSYVWIQLLSMFLLTLLYIQT